MIRTLQKSRERLVEHHDGSVGLAARCKIAHSSDVCPPPAVQMQLVETHNVCAEKYCTP